MNIEKVKKLTDEELRVKVAELCGWKVSFHESQNWWFRDGDDPTLADGLPNYPLDLNAMHKAVETLRKLPGPEWYDFGYLLIEECGSTMNCINATARVRAEVFVAILTP